MAYAFEHIFLNHIYISDMYEIVLIFFFHCKLCYFLCAHFVEYCFTRGLKSLYYILANDYVCSVTAHIVGGSS